MKYALLVVSFSLALAGCSRSVSKNMEYVITPDPAGNRVTFDCENSSTGKCHVVFTGAGKPSRTDISEGRAVTFRDIAAGTLYCAEGTLTALEKCTPGPLPDKRQTVKKKTSMSADAGE